MQRTKSFTFLVLILVRSLVGFVESTMYPIDGDHLGQPLHSVGAQSTAGTSRLLFDYPQVQRMQILDLLFKPQYGASFQHLKVEIGGDAQISCGSEPSPMRSPNASDDDFERGYEYWLMTEAKARNPDIVLLGLVYAWPDWINLNGTSPYQNPETEQKAANYVSKWVSGVRAAHNLTIDWVGLWNEREYTKSYVKTLRRTLDEYGHHSTSIVGSDRFWEPMATDYLSDREIREAISALTCHYPHCDARTGECQGINHNAQKAHNEYGVELWSSEDYSCWTDAVGAKLWASMINSQYIAGNITMISAWHLVSAFYSTVAFWNEGIISATQPWSGHYVAAPTIWASAHTTQFTRKGMRYLTQGKGAGELSGGGTFVSFYDPETKDLTIVVESAGPDIEPFSQHNCNGEHLSGAALEPQIASFALRNLPLPMGTNKLVLWRSYLGNDISESTLFEQMPDISIVADTVTITVQPNSIYTLSTVRTASKAANLPLQIPSSAAFPLPYNDDFESSDVPRPGKFWSDMEGGFQVSKSATDVNNQVLKQAVLKRACCNFIGNLDGPLPLSIIGSSVWENLEASISISVPDAASFGIFGIRAKIKFASFFAGGLGKPTGIFIVVDSYGYQLVSAISTVAGGLTWPCRAPVCITSGTFTTSATWRRLMMSVVNRTLRYRVDTTAVRTMTLPADIATGGGFAAIASSWSEVEFDNFTVRQATGDIPSSRCALQPSAGQQLVSLGCGEPAAETGSRWQLQSSVNGTGIISLRSDSSLCIASGTNPVPSPVAPTYRDPWNSSLWTQLKGTRFEYLSDVISSDALFNDNGNASIVVLAKCDEADPAQQWHYDAIKGSITQADGRGALAMGSEDAGDFATVTYGAPGIMWWSPDLGYIHGNANEPNACKCIAVCGDTSFLSHYALYI